MSRFRIIALVLLSASIAPCEAYGDRFVVPYYGGYGYGYYNGPYRGDDALELARIRRELRKQRGLDLERARRREQEMGLLRQQAMTSHQITAQQACYYRSTGGFELCADLFTQGSEAFADCESRVIQRNPSCNDVPLKGRGKPSGDEETRGGVISPYVHKEKGPCLPTTLP